MCLSPKDREEAYLQGPEAQYSPPSIQQTCPEASLRQAPELSWVCPVKSASSLRDFPIRIRGDSPQLGEGCHQKTVFSDKDLQEVLIWGGRGGRGRGGRGGRERLVTRPVYAADTSGLAGQKRWAPDTAAIFST